MEEAELSSGRARATGAEDAAHRASGQIAWDFFPVFNPWSESTQLCSKSRIANLSIVDI